jgi:hypothetical protein
VLNASRLARLTRDAEAQKWLGEYTALSADAIVQIGPGYWLHVPVGKLREDRYLPLHPELVTLIGD